MTAGALRATHAVHAVAGAVIPIVLALATGALIIWAMGRNPFVFYGLVIQYGLTGDNWMRSLVLMAPLLLIAVGLIVVFRGQLWNLGSASQFLLGAVVVSGFGPQVFGSMPAWAGSVVLLLGSMLLGAIWTLVPAVLKARYGTNEIVTSLVMNFIGIGVVNLLIKGPLKDDTVPIPQTPVLAPEHMIPYIGPTTIHAGLILALLITLLAQLVLSRTSFGLRLDVFGASPKAASHIGINSPRMVIGLFALSGALIGLAGGIDMLGHESYQRANWNPHYGDAIMPFVFLARLSPLAAIPLIAFYAVIATGGTLAAQQAGLNVDFLLVIVGLILLFMAITEYATHRRATGQRYLPSGLQRTVAGILPGANPQEGNR